MVMVAKFKGTCATCGATIRKGEQIEWSRGTGAKHITCSAQPDVNEDYPCSDMDYEDQCAAAVTYGSRY